MSRHKVFQGFLAFVVSSAIACSLFNSPQIFPSTPSESPKYTSSPTVEEAIIPPPAPTATPPEETITSSEPMTVDLGHGIPPLSYNPMKWKVLESGGAIGLKHKSFKTCRTTPPGIEGDFLVAEASSSTIGGVEFLVTKNYHRSSPGQIDFVNYETQNLENGFRIHIVTFGLSPDERTVCVQDFEEILLSSLKFQPTPQIDVPASAEPASERASLILQGNSFCRGGPGSDTDEIWTFYSGTELEIIGKDGDWWLVQFHDPGTRHDKCWIAGSNGLAQGNLASVPFSDYRTSK